ncbi:MAG: hypothetical protein NC299_12600 [Lachnospiraceae bacterium]|nr:hypothetical protein [Ruminococcus sp.]MCM1276180.1 hypothetical protein [Lachnospiraceae bacterium]
MDDLIEVLIESLFEGLVDGIDSASTSKRLPAGLRILFAALLFLFFGAVFGGMVFAGVMLIKEGTWLLGLIMFAIAAGVLGYLIWKFFKIFNGRSG